LSLSYSRKSPSQDQPIVTQPSGTAATHNAQIGPCTVPLPKIPVLANSFRDFGLILLLRTNYSVTVNLLTSWDAKGVVHDIRIQAVAQVGEELLGAWGCRRARWLHGGAGSYQPHLHPDRYIQHPNSASTPADPEGGLFCGPHRLELGW